MTDSFVQYQGYLANKTLVYISWRELLVVCLLTFHFRTLHRFRLELLTKKQLPFWIKLEDKAFLNVNSYKILQLVPT